MNTILKYPGSKWSIADWIISNFPEGYERMTYLEPFFGSGAVFFNKKRSVIETVNDLDKNVINLFRVIREQPDELARVVKLTPWSKDEYRASYKTSDNDIEDARRFLVRMWMAIGAKSSDIMGWRYRIKPGDSGLNAWAMNMNNRIHETASRLMHSSSCIVQIENKPAKEVIEAHSRPYVFIYCDPPYVMRTRYSEYNRIYAHEMTDEDHIQLLELLKKHPGPVMISGYDNEIYNDLLEGWRTERKKANCEGGQKRQEVIWMNYKPEIKQTSFFEEVHRAD